jgi:hypothetical protein
LKTLKNLFHSCGYQVDDRFLEWTTQDVIQCFVEDKAYYAVKECGSAGFGFDFMVHPDHRSAQIILDLGQEIRHNCAHLDYIYGFPNQRAVNPSKVFLGYKYFYEITLHQEPLRYFVHPEFTPTFSLPKVPFQWRYSKPGVIYHFVEGSILKIYQHSTGHILHFGGHLQPVLDFFDKAGVTTVSCWHPNTKRGIGSPFTLGSLPINIDEDRLWQVEMGDSDVF